VKPIPRVIIVDDEWIIREGLRKIINDNLPQYEIIAIVGNGIECLSLLESIKADLIITDIRMPYMDGLELMKIIRNKDLNIDIIVLSGYDDFRYCQEALKRRAIDYLLKPIDKNEFIIRLQKYALLSKGTNEKNSLQDSIPAETQKRIIGDIKHYIRINFDRKITLKMLSQKFYLNPNYLSQLFKKETGMNFIDYLTEFRIEKAKIALSDSTLRIADLSRNVGYESQKHFSAIFKKNTGLTPTEYREMVE